MNGTEKNEKRTMKPERILEMFLEVVNQHPSKSYDFPISNLLDQYMQCRLLPNFPEAAMVINSAGQVYSRKVDYLEGLLLAMHDKQNATERTAKPDNPEEADKTEKKRLPGKRLKTANQSSTTIQLAPPKQIKKSTNTVEKMNLNSSSDPSDSDRFKNYCQAVKSKIPVFYERVNLLISDSADNCFDGSRAISKDDRDCQKNYNVFIGSISFKEKQMMSQREFLHRIQFDDLDGGFDQNSPAVPGTELEHILNSTEINGNGHLEQSSIVAGDLTSILMDRINDTMGATDCDSAIVDDDMSQFNSINSTVPLDASQQDSTLNQSSIAQLETTTDHTANGSEVINSTIEMSSINQTNGDTTGAANETETAEMSSINQTNVDTTCAGNETELVNSTAEMSSINQTNVDTTCGGNESETINSMDISNINQTNVDGTCSISETGILNSTAIGQTNGDSTCEDLASMSVIPNPTDGATDCVAQINPLTGTTEGTSTNDLHADPLNPNLTTNAKGAAEISHDNSTDEKAECFDDTRNMFRIKDEYLKLNEVFRLPLSVLQQEVNITVNLFGIPFGRLRRQVKFALPKDFDSLRMNKRTRDADECSITGTRKFVKLNDGTATPSIELTVPSEQNIASACDPLTDPSIVPASTAETPPEGATPPEGETPPEGATPPEGPSQPTEFENSTVTNDHIGETPPEGDGQSNSQETSSEIPCQIDGETQSTNGGQLITGESSSQIPSQLVDDLRQSQDTAIADDDDDGQSQPKIARLDPNDNISVFDSGIGTCTEGSQDDGNIPDRRVSLDLTPPSKEIENELTELPVNRIKEMTNLSEKVHSWHQRLKPILLHSEKRNDFDVKETSQNIVKCFENRDISFKEVMDKHDKADTARYFFSMLQMANNENLKITVNHSDSSKLCPEDEIKLKLLNPNIREIELNETL